MKIGILTFHRAHNYGAMLQAYALREFLSQHFEEVSFIDYWNVEHQKEYSLYRLGKLNTPKNLIVSLLYYVLTFQKRKKRIAKFQSFSEYYLKLSKDSLYKKGKEIESKNYDVIVVGSDQVWRNYSHNMHHYGYNPVYFCEGFKSSKNITYAASMGIIQCDGNEIDFLKNHLKNFTRILVRENTLKDFINSLGFESSVVCDPTFLISSTFWNNLLPTYRYRKEKYVLFYELLESKEALSVAKSIARKLGVGLQVITARVHAYNKYNFNQTASPIEFLHSIRDAEYVVATSFHGTAFSVIFRKQFIVMGLTKSSDRVISLLKAIGLQNQYAVKAKDASIQEIKYGEVEQKIEAYIQQSKSELLKAIKE